MHFRTDEEIKQEIEEFNRIEKQNYEAHCKYVAETNKDDWGYNWRSLQKYKKVVDAKPIWHELMNKTGEDKQDLIDLLCQKSVIYDCSKGHTRRNYDLARLIRYSMSSKQRRVCYDILNDGYEIFK